MDAELYDRTADPIEIVSIASHAEMNEVVEQLSSQLKLGWQAAVP